jgi:hypothetical protein
MHPWQAVRKIPTSKTGASELKPAARSTTKQSKVRVIEQPRSIKVSAVVVIGRPHIIQKLNQSKPTTVNKGNISDCANTDWKSETG